MENGCDCRLIRALLGGFFSEGSPGCKLVPAMSIGQPRTVVPAFPQTGLVALPTPWFDVAHHH